MAIVRSFRSYQWTYLVFEDVSEGKAISCRFFKSSAVRFSRFRPTFAVDMAAIDLRPQSFQRHSQ